MKLSQILGTVLLAALALLLSAGALADNPPDICQDGANILSNCDFSGGFDSWHSFTEGGEARFDVLYGGGECHAPLCPAAYIVTEHHFVGGIYQQVRVAPGSTYFANVVWLVFDSVVNDASINAKVGGIGRRLGIDPLGGTDPTSSNIIWGAENWRTDCKICDGQEVTATAQSDTITLFVRIDDTWRLRAEAQGFPVPTLKDQFWIDDVGMKAVDGSSVNLPAPSPTDTPPPPPTDTPALPPTDTPAPAGEVVAAEASISQSATDTPEATQTDEADVVEEGNPSPEEGEEGAMAAPTETPAPKKSVAPPPTITPTATPSPTSTPAEQARLIPTHPPRATEAAPEMATISAGATEMVGAAACVGGLAVVGLLVTGGGLFWLYRLSDLKSKIENK